MEAAVVAYLRERGWDVTTANADFTDVVARRGSELVVAEVKERRARPASTWTSASGSCCAT